MSRMYDAIVAGHICLDISPLIESDKEVNVNDFFIPGRLINFDGVQISAGGPVANTGFAMKRLGLCVAPVANIGADTFGDILRDIIANEIDIELLPKKDIKTSYSIVLSIPGIDRIILHDPAGNNEFSSADINDALTDAKLFHFGYPPLMKRFYQNYGIELKKMFAMAKERDMTTSLDMSLPDVNSESGRADWQNIMGGCLPFVDVFLPSVEEALYIFDKDAYMRVKRRAGDDDFVNYIDLKEISNIGHEFIDMGVAVAVIKCGSKGIYTITADENRIAKIGAAKPKDINNWCAKELFEETYRVSNFKSALAGGDTTIAGFLAALLRGYGIYDCMKIACKTGALCCTTYDAVSGLIPLDEIYQKTHTEPSKNHYSGLQELFRYDNENKVWSKRQMKKAVMYGEGNIGRGFIGKTFSESGYEVCFIDIDKDIVEELNKDRQYPVRLVFNDNQREDIVKNVRAVNGLDLSKAAEEIASADIMATAVGVNVLPKIVEPICAGLKKRFAENACPLNIIICENLIDADKYLRKLIENEMDTEYKELLDEKLGLVEASIGRMAPVMTDEMRKENVLRVWVEPYAELPVDKAAFVGGIPPLKGLVPYSPFGYYIKRKLFIHNMGHALCAYIGYHKGYTYIYECVIDESIRTLAHTAMKETAGALNKEYGISFEELERHIDDLLNRFANQALGDTVARVGRDPLRKLGHNDRLVGAALYCIKQGIEPVHIIRGIVAGLWYDNAEDESSVKMRAMIKESGISGFLSTYCGLKEGAMLFDNIMNLYQQNQV